MHLWTEADEERREVIAYEAWTLRAACDAKGWRHGRLADVTGIPLKTLRNYLYAHRGMRLQVITTIAAALGVDIDPLLVPRTEWEERYGRFMCIELGSAPEKKPEAVKAQVRVSQAQSRKTWKQPLRKCHTAGCENMTTDFWCKDCKAARASRYGFNVEELGHGKQGRK